MSLISGPSLLFADLYELTMGAGLSLPQTWTNWPVFPLFVRKKRNSRAYFVCAGVNEAVQAVARLGFFPRRTWPISRA